jgi:transcriptional regulator with XRE-family HTH domain
MSSEQSLGAYIRENRLKKDISLRKFAQEVGISPTMMSKVEHDEMGFKAGEDTLKRIADLLDVDRDYLLSLAKKVDTNLQNMIMNKPHIMPQFLRTVGNASDETLRKIMRDVTSNDEENP